MSKGRPDKHGLCGQIKLSKLQRRYGSFWPLIMGLCSLMLIFFGGVYGYMAVEGWTYLESFYMVLIALSTVGFEEVHPLSENGMVLTSVLLILGVGNFAFLIGSFTQILVEGRLQTVWGRHRVQKSIDKLTNHTIVCGYGRIGSIAVREIEREGLPVVAVEMGEELIPNMEEDEILFISGDATSDDVLTRAGIHRAKNLITALSSEAANVYVSLTARQLNPALNIVARANNESHINRLKHAGADRVMLPHTIGGIRMAQSVVRPAVTSFLELAVAGDGVELSMEELTLSDRSELCGKNLIESKIRQRFNVIIISLKHATGEVVFNPDAKTVLAAGDTVIAVGDRENLGNLWEVTS
ncbi:potassium channel family protein [Desulfovibrio ferrophilus]|uniref:TrkA-N domain protein n=1 Tax=Desulfovibrio ferrophilus TaxID=241368 RepID=A0A2Z6AWE9_9BACT|nr:potassium channel protein [Desulfovibrio ferrophilus]BBD07513.1 TrkA-N domain protein [Desulfovibrio ferrophilus]